jgi:N-acetylglucosamine-6-phosphate deacetylase
VHAAVIADGIHVHPAMLRLISLARGEQLILATDRVALAGGDQIESTLFGQAVSRATIADGAARLPDGTLAGSVASMLDGIRIMDKCANVGLLGASRAASYNPASILHLLDRGSLTNGARADLILLDPELNLKAVFIGGHEID